MSDERELRFEFGDDADLVDDLRDYAAGWRPQPGDTVQGRIAGWDEGVSSYNGKAYPILIIEARDGQRTAVHAFHSVLADQLAKLGAAFGDRIGILYQGKRDGAAASYHAYRTIVQTPGQPPRRSWELPRS